MLCVVAHDAGGAELISSYIRRSQIECNFVLEGPALSIFARKLGKLSTMPLSEGIARSDNILCGTSWKSDLEFSAITMAKVQGIPSIAFLDHWSNYKTRFLRSGVTSLPDEIWVTDHHAQKIAKREIPGCFARLVGNPYFEDIKDELERLPQINRPTHGSLLFLSEPVSQHALEFYGDSNYFGYTELEALRYLLSNVSEFLKEVSHITIRPHPSDRQGKYGWVTSEFPMLDFKLGGSDSLLSEISSSDIVTGCNSVALVIGVLAKKRVISVVPPGGKYAHMPYAGIEFFRDYVGKTVCS